jgi:hypothetical protein
VKGPNVDGFSNEEKRTIYKYLEQKEIEVQDINIYFAEDLQTVEGAVAPIKNTMKTATALVVVSNPITAMQMVKLMQYFDFLRLVNIKELPANFSEFLEIFSSNVLDIMPNPLEAKEDTGDEDVPEDEEERILSDFDSMPVSSSNRYCHLHNKFSGQDLSCLILNNVGNLYIEVVLFFLLKAFLKTLVTFTSKHNNQKSKKTEEKGFSKHLKTAYSYLSFAFFIEFIIAIHLDIIMAAFINLRNFWVMPFIVWINSMIALLCIVGYLYLIRLSIKKSLKIENIHHNKNLTDDDKKELISKNKLEKWEFLKEPLKDQRSKIGGLIQEILFAKDFAVGFFIVLFVEYPIIQLLPSIAIFVATSFLTWKYNPYDSKLLFLTVFVNELTYLLVLLIFLTYHFFGESMNMKKRYDFFGYGLIILVLLSILFNMMLGLIGAFLAIKASCSKKKKSTADKEKVRTHFYGIFNPY